MTAKIIDFQIGSTRRFPSVKEKFAKRDTRQIPSTATAIMAATAGRIAPNADLTNLLELNFVKNAAIRQIMIRLGVTSPNVDMIPPNGPKVW